MRKIIIVLAVLGLFFFGVLIFSQTPTYMSVMVKETQARVKPSYLGKVLAVLSYGERLRVNETSNSWCKITLPDESGEGWVQQSALTKKTIVMNAGDKDIEQYASSDDVVLAGKGFNEQVENQYKQDNNIDFSLIDEMEQNIIDVEEMEAFLMQGDLVGVEGVE